MKKTLLIAVSIAALNAYSIGELLDKIKNIPDTKIDQLLIKQTKINKKSVDYSLMPKVSLNASIEQFSTPASLKPLTPTESSILMQKNLPIPFSKNIKKIGFSFSVPIYVKEIYDTKKKMSFLLNAVTYQSKINLLKRQSILVTLISKLNYLFDLQDALLVQKKSISKTLQAIKTGVEVGRIPGFKLLRLKDSLNKLNINISSIKREIFDTESNIYNLTKIKLNSKTPLTYTKINSGEFIALKPLKEKLKSATYDIKAAKDKKLPKLFFKIQGYKAFADAYNTDSSVEENFASAGIYLTWEIFNKQNDSSVQKAKLENLKNSLLIQKTVLELNSQIDQINKSVKELKHSLKLSKENISLKKELLKSAKTAFLLNRMSVDDYLDYENQLALAKADYSKLIATLNSLIAQKAFIYGKNLKKVFK